MSNIVKYLLVITLLWIFKCPPDPPSTSTLCPQSIYCPLKEITAGDGGAEGRRGIHLSHPPLSSSGREATVPLGAAPRAPPWGSAPSLSLSL